MKHIATSNIKLYSYNYRNYTTLYRIYFKPAYFKPARWPLQP